MFLNILVALDGSAASVRAVAEAADLARVNKAKLTLITVTPPVIQSAPFAGMNAETLLEELNEWAARTLRDARASLPDDVVAHTVQRHGQPGHEIVAELERAATTCSCSARVDADAPAPLSSAPSTRTSTTTPTRRSSRSKATPRPTRSPAEASAEARSGRA